jgi:16S rRNA (cytosine1402-N4)-methyltransferase
MKKVATGDDYPPGLPIPVSMMNPTMKIVGKMIRAGKEEVAENARSRSAVLRVAEKVAT